MVPKEGIEINLPDDKVMTKVTMEANKGGMTLAVVGSASAASPRQTVTLMPSNGGITLALVGSASGTKN